MSDELIALTEELITSIAEADWETYESLCDPTITAFEPESCGHLVDGLAFHRFYFDLGSSDTPKRFVDLVGSNVDNFLKSWEIDSPLLYSCSSE